MENHGNILCFGEILWDALPDGLFLGGAPLNVCYHLNQLDINAGICSRVGNDRLGKEAVRRIEARDMQSEHIQWDDEQETGFVQVEIDDGGVPEYEIIKPAAWDFIEPTEEVGRDIEDCWALVFGSLVQRSRQSRETLQKLLERNIKKVLDLNLRFPHGEKENVHNSLEMADMVKMNEDELKQIKKWFSIEGDLQESVSEVAGRYGCSTVCVSRGREGAVLWHKEDWYEHPGYEAEVKDSIGAGDAFLASLLAGIKKDREGVELLSHANAAGALVAGKRGAMPDYGKDSIENMMH